MRSIQFWTGETVSYEEKQTRKSGLPLGLKLFLAAELGCIGAKQLPPPETALLFLFRFMFRLRLFVHVATGYTKQGRFLFRRHEPKTRRGCRTFIPGTAKQAVGRAEQVIEPRRRLREPRGRICCERFCRRNSRVRGLADCPRAAVLPA